MPFEEWDKTLGGPTTGFDAWDQSLKPATGFDSWDTSLPTEDTQENLFARFGKQFYNVAVATPVQAVGTKSTLGEASTLMNTLMDLDEDVRTRFESGVKPLTLSEIERYTKPYKKSSLPGLFGAKLPEWQTRLAREHKMGLVPIRAERTVEERMNRLDKAAVKGKQKAAQQADVSATVKEASNWVETGVDVVAGITGFVAQLAALKKAIPSLPQVGIWELQNQIEGGTPGMGALSYAAFTGPGKLIPGKGRVAEIGKTALQSGAFASVNAVEQMIDEGEIDPVSVLIAAGIPIGLKVAGGAGGRLKRLIKAKNPKVMKALSEKYPETLSAQPEFTVTQGGHTKAVDTRGINTQKAVWENKWGGRNTSKLNTQMQGLLDKAAAEKVKGEAPFDTPGQRRRWLSENKILTKLADDMEKLDVEIERIASKNLHKASIKQLHALARKHKIDVPKGTTKTGIKRLLAGQQGVVETESGYAVRNLLSKGEAGTAWEIDRYATQAEALEVFHNQQVAMHEALGRGTGQLTGKPRIRVAAEVGRTTAPTPLNVTGPGATSIEEATKSLVAWGKMAKPIGKTEVKAAIKANQQRQTAAGVSATRRAILGGKSAHKSIISGMAAMKGRANTPRVTPPNLSKAQWEAMERKVIDVWPLEKTGKWFNVPNTFKAIDKIKNGIIPAPHEWGLLQKLLGKDAVASLYKSIVKPYEYTWADAPWLARDILKMTFAYDIQFSPVRQTSGIVARHPIIAEKAFDANVRAYPGERLSAPSLLRRASRRAVGKKNPKFESRIDAAKRINAEIEAAPGYKESKEFVNYVGQTPWASKEAGTKLQQYGQAGDFLSGLKGNNPATKLLRKWGEWINASERGANAGHNTAIHLLWAEGEKDLARELKRKTMTAAQIKKFRVDRGRDIMSGLKRRTAFTKQGKQIERAANWVLFSPANTWSRMIQPFQVIKRLAVGKDHERTYAAELLLSNILKISAMGSIAAYTGHRLRANDPTEEPYIDGSNDPTNPMWGKTRWGNDVYDPSGGDASTLRAFARIGQSAYMHARGQGDTAPKAGEIAMRWLNNRETVLLGLGKTLMTGKDWLGRPISGIDALLKAFPIEFVVSAVEAGTADGTWEQLSTGDIQEASKDFIGNIPIVAAGLIGMGTGSYPVRAATARYNFKNFIAEKEHGKEWDDLTIGEQRRLTRENRKQFEVLDRQVKVERVDDPYDPERQIEEARLSQEKITGLLSKPNRTKIAGFNIAVSRRPKNFFLNDERYQKYQELTAKYLNERLSKRNLEGRSQRTKDILLELDVKLAKDKAFRDIRRDM